MRGRKPRHIIPKRMKTQPAITDPDRPGSAFYAERHRQTVSVTPSGLRIISKGEPLRVIGRESVPLERDEPEAPSVPVSAPPARSEPRPASPSREPNWRDDYGLRKGR
jgi:hypothetical protein